jgi:hypothetical protein
MNEKIQVTDTPNSILPQKPHYAACTAAGWGIEMLGLEAMDGSGIDHAGVFGLPITNFTVEAADIIKARVRNKRGKWLEYKTGFGMNSIEGLGDGTVITGIEIVGDKFYVAVHVRGGSWLNPVKTSATEGVAFAGNGAPIDAIWIEKI